MQTFPKIEELIANGVHILDGIAGSAKTSKTVQLLQENGVDYMHTTATHKLRRDIETRFNHPAETVAGGLFKSNDGEYYTEIKHPACRVIIIDEILQTDPRTFDFLEENKNDHSIIICTDSKQMLAAGQGERCLRNLQDLEKQGCYRFNKSLRPVDDETRFLYSYGYGLDSNGTELFRKLLDAFTIETKLPDYCNSNAYLFHTNALEKSYYESAGLYNRYDIDLIPKGRIAAHPTHKTNYPILPQIDADAGKVSSYYQAANCGSVLRFQGSEVMPEDDLYFIFNRRAVVHNRECYTMLTRMKSIKSLHLVAIDAERDIPAIISFAGKPVVHGFALRTENAPGSLKPEDISRILDDTNKTSERIYDKVLDTSGNVMTGYENAPKTSRKTLWGMCKKQPSLQLNRINLFYQTCENVAPGYIPKAVTQEDFQSGNYYGPYDYFVDLVSSYPHQWMQGMPDCSTYTPEIDADFNDPEYQQIWICTSNLYDPGAIITDDLNSFMYDHHAPAWNTECIGCVKISKFDRIGQYMMDQCYGTVESKAQFKEDFKWGWMMKPYIEPVQWNGYGDFKKFLLHPENRYLLSIAFIHSRQMLVMSKLKQLIFGTIAYGETKVDALYFNYAGKISDLAPLITKTIPGYDFRIYKNDARKTADCTLLYSSCTPLITKNEAKAAKEKARRESYKHKNNGQ